MACKGVRPTTTSGYLALGLVYVYTGYNPCIGIHVPYLGIYDTALGSMYLYLDISIDIGICAIFLRICDSA
jgi:hypothetical protein